MNVKLRCLGWLSFHPNSCQWWLADHPLLQTNSFRCLVSQEQYNPLLVFQNIELFKWFHRVFKPWSEVFPCKSRILVFRCCIKRCFRVLNTISCCLAIGWSNAGGATCTILRICKGISADLPWFASWLSKFYMPITVKLSDACIWEFNACEKSPYSRSKIYY